MTALQSDAQTSIGAPGTTQIKRGGSALHLPIPATKADRAPLLDCDLLQNGTDLIALGRCHHRAARLDDPSLIGGDLTQGFPRICV